MFSRIFLWIFLVAGIIYTAIWNFVDFPAGIVRFGTESGKNIESYDDQGEKLFKDTKDVSAVDHSLAL